MDRGRGRSPFRPPTLSKSPASSSPSSSASPCSDASPSSTSATSPSPSPAPIPRLRLIPNAKLLLRRATANRALINLALYHRRMELGWRPGCRREEEDVERIMGITASSHSSHSSNSNSNSSNSSSSSSGSSSGKGECERLFEFLRGSSIPPTPKSRGGRKDDESLEGRNGKMPPPGYDHAAERASEKAWSVCWEHQQPHPPPRSGLGVYVVTPRVIEEERRRVMLGSMREKKAKREAAGGMFLSGGMPVGRC